MKRRISAIIIVRGNFKNTGFGFSCLQQAIRLEVEGAFKYINEEEVSITVSGSKKSLENMLNWCKHEEVTSKATLEFLEHEPIQYHGFEIVNVLENGKVESG